MERDGLASVAGFFSDANALEPGTTIVLGEDAAHHARVRRLEAGAPVYVADGKGAQATGSIVRLGKKDLAIKLDDVRRSPRPPEVHVLVPIADRDRMLWCAEKCTTSARTISTECRRMPAFSARHTISRGSRRCT